MTRAIEALLEGDAHEIGRKCIEMAKDGDATALRLAMERICPVRRARIRFNLPPVEGMGDLPKALSAVLEAIADGSLAPDEGAAIASALTQQQRMFESVELERRIAALEEARGGSK
jgi:hypothetical protein